MRQYEIYIQLENIESRFLLFSCRHRQWQPDKAQVLRPGNLVDDEEWEADYYDLKSQLNKRGTGPPHVESP
jgi:hypothetical protein